jgi:hypothetical protein
MRSMSIIIREGNVGADNKYGSGTSLCDTELV